MSHRFSDDIPRLTARLFFTAALLFSLPAPAEPRVATSDWTVAETLTAMGHPPVSVADRRVYDTWVNHPPLPAAVKEAGLRFQPNLERLYQIKPDFFVQSSWYAAAKSQFEKSPRYAKWISARQKASNMPTRSKPRAGWVKSSATLPLPKS